MSPTGHSTSDSFVQKQGPAEPRSPTGAARMKPASLKQIVLGTVFTASLMGCASEEPELMRAENSRPAMIAGRFSSMDVDAGLAQAQAERHGGDLNTASQTLARLMLSAPDDPFVLGEYGKTLIGEGRNGEALGFLERAVALRPGEWSFHSAKGVVYDLMGDHLEAQMAYDRALAVKPGDPTVLSNSAMSHMEMGDLDTAESLLVEASQNGGDPRIKQNLTMIQAMKRSPSRVASIMEMRALPGPADAAPQLMVVTMHDMNAPLDVAPVPDVQMIMPVPDSDPATEEEDPIEADQATRGQSIAFDPALAEDPRPRDSQPLKAKSPKQPQVKAAAKTAKAKISSKKPASKNGSTVHAPSQPDEAPAKQAALN